jgi:WD40 repeat protein
VTNDQSGICSGITKILCSKTTLNSLLSDQSVVSRHPLNLFPQILLGYAKSTIRFGIVFIVVANARGADRPNIAWMRGGHSAFVRSIACSRDGFMLASASDDWTAKVWRMSDRQLIRTLIPHGAPCSSIAFSPNGAWLATGTDTDFNDKCALKVYAIDDATEIFARVMEFDEGPGIQHLAFSPDGRLLAVAGMKMIQLYQTNDWTPLTLILPGGEDVDIRGIDFSPDGSNLVAGVESNDQAVLAMWRVSGGSFLWQTNAGGSRGGPAAFAPGGNEIVWAPRAGWAEGSGLVEIRSAANGSFLEGLNATNVISIAFSPDAYSAAFVSWLEDEAVQVWDWPAKQLSYRIPATWPYGTATFSADSELVLAGGGYYFPAGVGVKVWRVAGGQPEAGFDQHARKIEKMVFSPDNSMLASGGSDYTVRLWRVATGEQIAVLHQGYVITALAFSPDSSLVVASGSTDVVRLWSTNGTLIRSLNYPFASVRDAAFSSNGNFVAVAFVNETVVFDVTSGNRTTNGPPPESFLLGRPDTYSYDNRWMAKFYGGTVWMGGNGSWPLGGGGVGSFAGRALPGMAFTIDTGTLLVAGTHNPTLEFWGTTSYTLAQTYTDEVAGGAPHRITDGDDRVIGRWTGATAVACSHDKRFFAYGRIDGTVVLAGNQFATPVGISVRSENGAVHLNWYGGNRYYQLQRKNNLTIGEWETISPAIATTNAVVDPAVSSAAFYRVLNLGN